MRSFLVFLFAVSFAPAQGPGLSNAAIIARAKALEFDTPYVPPPGEALVHETGAYAKVVCSAVFISGFTPEFAAENLGYVVSPYADRQKVGKPSSTTRRRRSVLRCLMAPAESPSTPVTKAA